MRWSMSRTGENAMSKIQEGDKVRASEAAVILGVTPASVHRLARLGKLTPYRLPNCQPRFSRAECQRMASEAAIRNREAGNAR
jgi:hypothetical protein